MGRLMASEISVNGLGVIGSSYAHANGDHAVTHPWSPALKWIQGGRLMRVPVGGRVQPPVVSLLQAQRGQLGGSARWKKRLARHRFTHRPGLYFSAGHLEFKTVYGVSPEMRGQRLEHPLEILK